MVHPYDMAEESSSKSYGGWWDGPDMGEAWLPDGPHIDPHSFAVIYFDVLGTLIDNETGIWNALQPLLERSGKDLSRIEALGLYFEAEEEVKERASSDEPLLQQCYEEFALRLGLTWTSSESSAFASSIASWLLCPGALEWIRKLHPHLSLVALIDIDAQSLSSCTAFSLLRPYFSETMMQFDHEKLKVPSTGQCIVSSSLYWGIEPARWVDVPGVWLRLPGSLAATAPDEPDGRDQWGGHELCILSWRECYGLEKLAPLLLGKEEHTTAEVKGDDALDLVELSRVDSGYASA
ncbi:hypothetical protein FB45DRAFT_226 [Roridomyces roridus]|uniref:Uncharacterized protein n=1 Tax=Roridomyces roridus TaxID=1738132 RepID=A0AAD7CJZ1_9AGAR|nr:hypothetical protein FB45DRAFT_226 [Roridomyces roridus]